MTFPGASRVHEHFKENEHQKKNFFPRVSNDTSHDTAAKNLIIRTKINAPARKTSGAPIVALFYYSKRCCFNRKEDFKHEGK